MSLHQAEPLPGRSKSWHVANSQPIGCAGLVRCVGGPGRRAAAACPGRAGVRPSLHLQLLASEAHAAGLGHDDLQQGRRMVGRGN